MKEEYRGMDKPTKTGTMNFIPLIVKSALSFAFFWLLAYLIATPSNAVAARAATGNARSYATNVIGEAPASIACEPHFRGLSRDTECVLRFRNRPSVFVVCSVVEGVLSSGCRLSQLMVQK